MASTPPLPLLHFHSLPPKLSPTPRLHLLITRCSTDSNNQNPPLSKTKDVSAMVDDLLKREENKELLNGLQSASQRVDKAREALADIERQEAEVSRAKEVVSQLEKRKFEIEESQRELLEARTLVEEAEASLSHMDESSYGDAMDEEINRDLERLESAKAAVISSIVGTLAGLPIYLYQNSSYPQLILDLSVTFISCALFGVTFRYTIRRDLDNVQLKTGAPAAFGFVKGLGALEAGRPLESSVSSLISHSIDGAVYVSENIFIFLSAAVALDFCLKMKFVSPFPIRKAN